jgi:SSS family transporter
LEAYTIDYIIIITFLIGIAIIGSLSGGKQKSVSDYFHGSRKVSWWSVCFAIVAAETSTLTFISIPGLAYLTNLNFLQVTFGYLVGRIIVAKLFLPAYYKGELKTAYSYLEDRFGRKTRTAASFVFMFTRIAADGVRLFATAIPLYLILKIDPIIAIILIAIVALVYTYTGGLRGVIKVDVILMFLYIGGAILAAIYLINLLPNGWTTVLQKAAEGDKLSFINLGFEKSISGFFSNPYTLIGGILGGAFLSMASHGTDQLIVQRLFATKNLKSAQKAIIGSGIIVIVQFAIFLVLGVMLYSYYGPMDVKSDEIFPRFIIEVLPPGITGIIIAGLFAAAMSILSAMIFKESSRAVVEIALSIAAFTYGGLLGTFLLGLLFNKVKQKDALIAFGAGIVAMVFVIFFSNIGWTWYTLIGVTVTIFTGILLSLFKI